MSQENVEIVQSAFDAWDRGDTDAILAVCDEDIGGQTQRLTRRL
jgi:ketosteroid isomerase-like protein